MRWGRSIRGVHDPFLNNTLFLFYLVHEHHILDTVKFVVIKTILASKIMLCCGAVRRSNHTLIIPLCTNNIYPGMQLKADISIIKRHLTTRLVYCHNLTLYPFCFFSSLQDSIQ